jgi:hypothetical protein
MPAIASISASVNATRDWKRSVRVIPFPLIFPNAQLIVVRNPDGVQWQGARPSGTMRASGNWYRVSLNTPVNVRKPVSVSFASINLNGTFRFVTSSCSLYPINQCKREQ